MFVAIDRATRWVYFAIYANQSEASATHFLRELHRTCPVKIKTILTDNGAQFTDRFTCKQTVPSGEHGFDRECTRLSIEHRLIPPRRPQTNGMVERLNGRISEVVQQTRFSSAYELRLTLEKYLKLYNHQIPQLALGHITPIAALKHWQKPGLELFTKRVYDHAKLDSKQIIEVDDCGNSDYRSLCTR